jgi:hydrogenase 3 maturation protease
LPKREYDVERELREWFRGAGRVVVVGVGNPIRMDDFVGMKIVQDLKGHVDADRVMLIEAETVPENHIQEIIEFKPTHILIIDAAKMGLKFGEVRLMNPEKLTDVPAISTHILPIRIFCEHIAGETASWVRLLLIEPQQTDFGEKMTPEVEFSACRVVNALLRVFNDKPKDQMLH